MSTSKSAAKRRFWVFVGALVVSMAALLSAATAANAWPWHPTVHVAGNAGCNGFAASAKEVWINGAGQARQAIPNWLGNYGVDMYNVPSNGTGARADVRCSGPLGNYWYSRNFTLFRPGVGTQISVNFKG